MFISLKSYCFICVLFLYVNGKHWTHFKESVQRCKDEFKIEDEAFWHFRKLPLPDDKKCFHFCLATNLGVMDENGNFTLAKFEENNLELPTEIFKNHQECSQFVNSSEKCLKAEQFNSCIKKKHLDKLKVFYKNKQECLNEFDIPISKLRERWIDIPDEKMCYYKCMAEKSNLFNEKWEISYDTFKKTHINFPVTSWNEISKCVNQHGEFKNTCELAKQFYLCLKARYQHWKL